MVYGPQNNLKYTFKKKLELWVFCFYGFFLVCFLVFGGFFFFGFLLFRAKPAAYLSSQARGQIRAAAASLHQSHRNAGSELHLRPTSQLTAMPDPSPLNEARDQTHILMDASQVHNSLSQNGNS